MAEILFYHLTESTLEEALPGLVDRSIARRWRVVIQAGSDERRDALDNHLWTWSEESFLAHGTDHEPHAPEQPIILTTGTGNPNGATVRFLVDGADLADASSYERLVVMFDGHDAEPGAERFHEQVVHLVGVGAPADDAHPGERVDRPAGRVALDKALVPRGLHEPCDPVDGEIPRSHSSSADSSVVTGLTEIINLDDLYIPVLVEDTAVDRCSLLVARNPDDPRRALRATSNEPRTTDHVS